MPIEDKYLVYKFILSEIARQTGKRVEDFGMLSRMKLLFFFCTLAGEDRALFYTQVFDNFYAEPMGPVESEVSNREKQEFFKDEVDTIKYRERLVPIIQRIISDNLSTFRYLVKFNGIELCNISQNFISWRKHFLIANREGRKSEKIDHQYLVNEPVSL
jgi:hypothetical protein